MRTYPEKKILFNPIAEAAQKKKTTEITRKVAIYFSLFIVAFFFYKMLAP